LSYRNELRIDEIDVVLATLDDPTALAPQSHTWVQDKRGLPLRARNRRTSIFSNNKRASLFAVFDEWPTQAQF